MDEAGKNNPAAAFNVVGHTQVDEHHAPEEMAAVWLVEPASQSGPSVRRAGYVNSVNSEARQ